MDNHKEIIFQLPHTTTAQEHLSRWISLAGLKKKITWHSPRHTFTFSLLNAGTDRKTVSSL
ncbi:MAG: tyrosine-type recombinase/integrase [Muribaculaceae bacterium]|nr:tyrosine-type recombinase/integrase [Muribaculaceae bacterium]